MNVNPGGKQNIMRPGWYLRDGVKVEQKMVFEDRELTGVAKGLRQVCRDIFGDEKIRGRCS